MEVNVNTNKTEMTDINKNLEDFKEQHKQEFKELRKAVQNIETSQNLIKQQYKEEFKELEKCKTSRLAKIYSLPIYRKGKDYKD